MFSIDVELLTSRYVATRYDLRSEAEWPPHPARLFSACVATLHEVLDVESAARTALEWLEEQPPPHIVAGEIGRRTVCNVFVPVNDTRVTDSWERNLAKVHEATELVVTATSDKARASAEKKLSAAEKKLHDGARRAGLDTGKRPAEAIAAAASLLPERRRRQPRTFPSVSPTIPHVSFVWPDVDLPDGLRAPLAMLLSRVARLGHSSSLVACSLGDGSKMHERASTEVWRPANEGEPLRVVNKGQLARLEAAFKHHQSVEPRSLPCGFQLYQHGVKRGDAETHESSVFGHDWIVFRFDATERRPPRLRLTRGIDVARALRGALLKYASGAPPPALSGHDAQGSPLDRPHLAYLPLPDVLSSYSSGAILGVALVLPRALGDDDRHAIFAAIRGFEQSGARLFMGRAGEVRLQRLSAAYPDGRKTLQAGTWTGPRRRWASVTPIALDRNPRDFGSHDPDKATAAEDEAERTVRVACKHIGLPEPAWVQVMRRSLFDSAPKAKAFMPYPREGQGPQRLCVHVELEFHEPVKGPVLLGAGRYFGLGFCAPRRET